MSYEFSSVKASVSVAVPLIALGGTTTVTASVPGCRVGQVVLVNVASADVALLSLLSAPPEGYVSADGTVTIRLRAGVAVSAGTRTFLIRVFP